MVSTCRARWIRWFGSLQMAACVLGAGAAVANDNLLSLYEHALGNNPTWLAANAESMAAKEQVPQALGQLLPNISASGTHYKTDTEQTVLNRTHSTANYVYDSYNYSISLRQPIFRVYNFALYAQAKDQERQADALLDQALQDLAVQVSTAYFDVLLAKSDVDVNLVQQQAYREHRKYAEKAFEAGHGTRTDVDEATSRLDMEEARGVELKYRLEYTLDQLEAVVGRDVQSVLQLQPQRVQLQKPEPNDLEAWITRAEAVNPSLNAMRALVDGAEKEVWKARSGHLPTVDLVGQISKSQSDTSSTIGSRYNTSAIGLQVSIPIFAGGHTQSTVRQAGYTLVQQKQRYDAARRDVGLQVRKEFDASSQGVEWVKAYVKALASAEQTLHSTKKGFEAGTRNRLDILNAEQSVAQARQNLNRGRYQYVLARIKLLGLVGQLDMEQMSFFNSWLEGKNERGGK